MACTRPLCKIPSLTGGYFFKRINADWHKEKDQLIPCGSCPACIERYKREWTGRILAETINSEHSHFATLTFKPEEQPLAISMETVQLFHMRLRYYIGPFRHYTVGEYGDIGQKAHYHMCLWPTKPLTLGKKVDKNLWSCIELEKAWTYGYNTVNAQLDAGSAAYVAGYVQKKKQKKEYIDGETGEILQRPFATMSLGRTTGNGIGVPWILKNQKAISINGFIIIGGRKYPVSKDVVRLMDEQAIARLEKHREQNTVVRSAKELEDIEINLTSKKRTTTI